MVAQDAANSSRALPSPSPTKCLSLGQRVCMLSRHAHPVIRSVLSLGLLFELSRLVVDRIELGQILRYAARIVLECYFSSDYTF